MSELESALQALSDDELRELIRAVTAGRPALAALHEATTVADATIEPAPVMPVVVAPPPDYTEAGVPTLSGVRDKVGRAIGAAELERETPHGKSLEEQWEQRRAAGHERLEQIRRSMKDRE